MLLDEIRIHNFRNYESERMNVKGAKNVFIVGENGHGKTNFLEALYYLGYAKSFRSQRDEHLVRKGEEMFFIHARFRDKENRENSCAAHYQKKRKEKTIKINGKKIKDKKEMLQTFPVLVFKHSDIAFVTGDPKHQRQLMDQTAGIASEPYVKHLRRYGRAIKQKNEALKRRESGVAALYNPILAESGLEIMKHRKKAVDFFAEKAPKKMKKIYEKSGDIALQTEVCYVSHWSSFSLEDIREIIDRDSEREEKEKCVISGPHRDRIHFFLDKCHFKDVASTGQIRLFSILLRTLQAEYHYQHRKTAMTYLFDDVMLEIDHKKRDQLLKGLPDARQRFFTVLPEEAKKINVGEETHWVFVKNGRFYPRRASKENEN